MTDKLQMSSTNSFRAYAALAPDGRVIAATVRLTPEDVRLAAGECKPVKVMITIMPDDWPKKIAGPPLCPPTLWRRNA